MPVVDVSASDDPDDEDEDDEAASPRGLDVEGHRGPYAGGSFALGTALNCIPQAAGSSPAWVHGQVRRLSSVVSQ